MSEHEAIELQPTSMGLSPLRERSEYCKDKIDGLYHFTTPDGTLFSTKEVRRCQKTRCITILIRPKFAGEKHASKDRDKPAVVDNQWTVTDGWWVRETD